MRTLALRPGDPRLRPTLSRRVMPPGWRSAAEAMLNPIPIEIAQGSSREFSLYPGRKHVFVTRLTAFVNLLLVPLSLTGNSEAMLTIAKGYIPTGFDYWFWSAHCSANNDHSEVGFENAYPDDYYMLVQGLTAGPATISVYDLMY